MSERHRLVFLGETAKLDRLVNSRKKNFLINVHGIHAQYEFLVFLLDFRWDINNIIHNRFWLRARGFSLQAGNIRAKNFFGKNNIVEPAVLRAPEVLEHALCPCEYPVVSPLAMVCPWCPLELADSCSITN